ncbi:hypothetical protein CGLO_05611 [Colletotrichum gloeosporioides Cg-14]|uniref:Uncharacterized protein n=1 Tax=Colletotrichum gloeosporioides (strain Cg-14) TaxID=1237896 RepID=T0KPU1_COLGC|nr:hypothetical protein CGLO_05611 [Colletotrichum gloeosporioides Cg-14]
MASERLAVFRIQRGLVGPVRDMKSNFRTVREVYLGRWVEASTSISTQERFKTRTSCLSTGTAVCKPIQQSSRDSGAPVLRISTSRGVGSLVRPGRFDQDLPSESAC